MKYLLCTFLSLIGVVGGSAADSIPQSSMQAIYNEVKTPYKYGLVIAPTDNYHKIDCPTVFREGDKWMMTYVCYDGKEGTDGRGYETWLAESADLLHWTTLGRILALPPIDSLSSPLWDENQRGGFPALIDWTWDGSYAMQAYKGRYWMTYIGGAGTGYEAVRAPLSIGLASTVGDVAQAHQWDTQPIPLLSYDDKDAQWWEKLTQYKSTIYEMKREQRTGNNMLPPEFAKYRFVMFYNAGGKNDTHPKGERIGIALSKDMKHWRRYAGNPVFAHDSDGTITGDAQIVRMGDVFVMFYFSAFNPAREYSAYNTFAVSRDLIHWQDWDGPDLIVPSKPYDEMFAHKSYVVKHDGVVYHFYCAVNNAQQRGIAVATSVPMGRSAVCFPEPEPTGKRRLISLNSDWVARCNVGRDTIAAQVNLPHNFDDYYGYRQLSHGNLHGSAIYNKLFVCEKKTGKRYFLQFEGVGTYATVFLNGHEYPHELVGRTVWTLDVTDAIADGQNSLQVLVDHPSMQTASPWVCGGCSSEYGFSEGSQPFGIFRPVTLVETDVVRIEPFGVHIWNNAACDSVFIETEVKNYSGYHQYIELVNKFAEKNGKEVFRLSKSIGLAPGETRVVRQVSSISNVHRWSLDTPYLYTLTSMVKKPEAFDGDSDMSGEPALVTTDLVSTPFGIRSISWPRSVCCDNGATNKVDHRFRLNGTPVFINGTCEYEHILGASHAFTPEQIRSRVKQIRNAGFNAFREAHQPHNLLYQQLFDEQGMLFWSQFSAHIWYDTPEFRDNFKRLLARWIKERRNSPSIILWGLQNESVLPRDFAEECTALIRSLDPTASCQRLITTCNGGEGTDWNVVQNWSGTYGGSVDNYAVELSHPDQLLNGEYGAWRTLDLHGEAKYSEESFTALLEKKARLAEQAFSAIDTTSVCGHFQWLFYSHDNPGRIQPDGALRRIDKIGPINYKGLTTIWEEPTQGYYMYRQRYAPTQVSRDSVAAVPTAADRNIDLLKGSPTHYYLCRINCGGDAYTDEFGQYWLADDSLFSHSWGQDFPGIHPFQASQRHITEDIRGTKSDELFQFFRFGRHRLWYDIKIFNFPANILQNLPQMDYRIELYFTEPWHGKGNADETADYEGLRIFDVAVNDSLVINDLDPWAEAGYCGALKRVVTAKAKDGKLRISFPEVKAGQAVLCGIAIAVDRPMFIHWQQYDTPNTPIWHAFDTDTIAKLPPELLPVDFDARPAVVYEPQPIAPMDVPGLTSFIIHPGLGQEYALRFRYKNLTGMPYVARMQLKDASGAMLVDRDITFPPTPDKFKMLNTTTGTQINAGTYHLTIEAVGLEFKNVEIQ